VDLLYSGVFPPKAKLVVGYHALLLEYGLEPCQEEFLKYFRQHQDNANRSVRGYHIWWFLRFKDGDNLRDLTLGREVPRPQNTIV
jgi:hypothetical protein